MQKSSTFGALPGKPVDKKPGSVFLQPGSSLKVEACLMYQGSSRIYVGIWADVSQDFRQISFLHFRNQGLFYVALWSERRLLFVLLLQVLQEN